MSNARVVHTATLLGDGVVLVAGGSVALPSAELYDAVAAAGTWTAVGSLATGRYQHTATRLGNGEVLAAGGENAGTYLASAELYDPVASTWAAAASLSAAREQHSATLLGNGEVLVAGGWDASGAFFLASAEPYDPVLRRLVRRRRR